MNGYLPGIIRNIEPMWCSWLTLSSTRKNVYLIKINTNYTPYNLMF